MRIAMIGQKGIPFSEDGGGVDRHVEELSTRLADLGHEIFVYVRPRFTESKVSDYKGIKLISVRSVPTKNLDSITHTFFAIKDLIFKRKVDIVHFHGVGPGSLAWLVRFLNPSIKIVGTFHSIDRYHKKWGWFARMYLGWGERAICKFPHLTIAVSQSIKKYCKEKFNKDTKYIPNGVGIVSVNTDELLKQFGLTKDGYFLTVARLVRHKGIHHLIEAYKKLEKKFGKINAKWPNKKLKKLVIVGSPSYTEDYLKYLKQIAGSSKNIIFTGFQGGETLDQLFSNAFLYIHPSESEGLSTTILESLSHRTPALISDITENLEVIDHSGFIFKTKSPISLYRQMVKLLQNPELIEEKKNRAQRFIKKNFNWNHLVKITGKAYKTLLD